MIRHATAAGLVTFATGSLVLEHWRAAAAAVCLLALGAIATRAWDALWAPRS